MKTRVKLHRILRPKLDIIYTKDNIRLFIKKTFDLNKQSVNSQLKSIFGYIINFQRENPSVCFSFPVHLK